MKSTIVGDFPSFAVASQVAADLMLAGFAQGEISVVGREKLADGARFAFAGALAASLSGAQERDFDARLLHGLVRMCVPPWAAARHAAAMADGGGLVAIHAAADRSRDAEAVMARHGVTERYAAGAPSLGRSERRVPGAASCVPASGS